MSTSSLLKQLNAERASLLAGVLPRVASVAVGPRRTLSAIRWRADLVVTAAEPLAGADRVTVHLDSGETNAEVLAADLTTDVAVLRVPGTGPLLAEAPAATLRVGEIVALVGREPTGAAATWGSVRLAGPAWVSRRGGEIARRLEFDTRFDPTFEGAAVIDVQGAISAMAVPGPFRRVLGIPAETIDQVVAKVERHGHLPRPYIGVRLQPLWLDAPARSQLGRRSRTVPAVSGIDAGSPAADAHLQLGDLLLRIDGQPIESADTLVSRIAGLSIGQTLAIEVLRGGKPVLVEVRVGERPRG